jgi:hypothetical protein
VYSVFVSGATSSNGAGSFAATVTVFNVERVVPEPATLISACVGLAGLGAYKLRRRQTVT